MAMQVYFYCIFLKKRNRKFAYTAKSNASFKNMPSANALLLT